MNSSHKIILVSACLLLIIGGTTSALVNHRKTTNINTRALASASNQGELRGQIARLRMEIGQYKKRSVESAGAPAPKTTRPPVLDSQSFRDRIAEDPTLVELRKNFFAAEAKLRLEHCFQFLHLSVDQITAVCDRMAQFNEQAEHLANQLPRNVSGASDPRLADYRNRSQKAQVEYEFDLKALLGNDGFEKLSEFQSHQEIWERTDNLASALYDTEPLSNLQSQQLFEVMKAHAAYSPGSSRANYDIPALAQEAAGFLSPLQLAILNKQLVAAKIW